MKVSQIFGTAVPNLNADFLKSLDMFKGYRANSFKPAEVKKILEAFSPVLPVPTLLGIEVEVENMQKEMVVPTFWHQEGDGSLRNGGREFKSWPLIPEHAFIATHILWNLFKSLSTAHTPDFSWRTSEHVHVSVQNLEEKEFRTILVLVALVEPLLFFIAGQAREQSNFCVPLVRSTMINPIRRYLNGKWSLKELHKKWNSAGGEHGHGAFKYAAVNLGRLNDLGTLEFRHLGGTEDVSLLHLWIQLLLKVYQAALIIPLKDLTERIQSVSSPKDYHLLLKDIFTKLPPLLETDVISLYDGVFPRIKELFVGDLNFPPVSPQSAALEYAEFQINKNPKLKKEPPAKKSVGTPKKKPSL